MRCTLHSDSNWCCYCFCIEFNCEASRFEFTFSITNRATDNRRALFAYERLAFACRTFALIFCEQAKSSLFLQRTFGNKTQRALLARTAAACNLRQAVNNCSISMSRLRKAETWRGRGKISAFGKWQFATGKLCTLLESVRKLTSGELRCSS